MNDYTDHLFSYLPPAQIRTLSCGHVIPPSNLLAWAVCRGVAGADFDFTFSTRGKDSMVSIPTPLSPAISEVSHRSTSWDIPL